MYKLIFETDLMRNVSFVNPSLLSWLLYAKPNLNWAKYDREPSDGQYSRRFEKKYRHFLTQFKSSFRFPKSYYRHIYVDDIGKDIG